MKRKTHVVGITAVVLASSLCLLAAAPAMNKPQFSERDLKGTYAFSIAGEATAGPIVGPVAVIGVFEADGRGNIPLATRTLNINGEIIVRGQQAFGTYEINPDGTGSATFFPVDGSAPESIDLVMISNKELIAISTDPGAVGQGPARRQ